MRSAKFAEDFEAAQDGFIRLVESLDDQKWTLVGKNYPQRINEEDEGRTVGVIAHHVAESGPFIIDRIEKMSRGEQLPPPGDRRALNAEHATQHRECTRDEVVRMLRDSKPRIAAAVRAIPDDQLDQERETPVGPMSVAQRLERVLIGHIKMHQGSIEAALAD
ncbi:MAG TPA: DinB family protein [Candidatus Dormibacteraeota bacterium]